MGDGFAIKVQARGVAKVLDQSGAEEFLGMVDSGNHGFQTEDLCPLRENPGVVIVESIRGIHVRQERFGGWHPGFDMGGKQACRNTILSAEVNHHLEILSVGFEKIFQVVDFLRCFQSAVEMLRGNDEGVLFAQLGEFHFQVALKGGSVGGKVFGGMESLPSTEFGFPYLVATNHRKLQLAASVENTVRDRVGNPLLSKRATIDRKKSLKGRGAGFFAADMENTAIEGFALGFQVFCY